MPPCVRVSAVLTRVLRREGSFDMTRGIRSRLCRDGLVFLSVMLCAAAADAAEWAPNTFYAVNALVTYQGPTYKCLQAHTSQVGWEPANVPALWSQQAGTPTATTPPRAA